MSEEKNCPYCAETIKAEAIKCRYCGSDLNADPDSPQTQEKASAPSVAACSDCNVALVSTQKSKAVSVTGFISVIVVLSGVVALLFNVLAGAIVIILGLLIGMLGGKKTIMICPQCGKEGTRLA